VQFEYYVEGPLLHLALLVFITSAFIRLSLFSYSMMRSCINRRVQWTSPLLRIRRRALPFKDMGSLKRCLQSAPKTVFHLCIIIVPVWTLGHVTLWEESQLGWSYTALPDVWSEAMTLAVIFLSGYFLVRRIILRVAYSEGHVTDCLLIVMTALPFVTGYFLSHGTPGFMSIPEDFMWTIHVLTGEIILFTAAVLFCCVSLDDRSCMGCAACGLICSTRALEALDHADLRSLSYCQSQCIWCGACKQACPENAIRLKHHISLTRLVQIFRREVIYSTELSPCQMCGKPLASIKQLKKAADVLSDEQVYLCADCKKTKNARLYYSIMC
jgi:ferredoxin